ncbi:MAG: 4-hydroxybenzoate octaprenyltransferase [Gammaproteobacteria bacterium]|nr:4-hydroxybenzoate octaprenyltransferase [Gammaproteobacteria bacterium]
MLIEKLKPYALLMRLDKPIGILLLLWPTLWAIGFASKGHPNYRVLTVFILGVILMRSAGCIINDFADRHFDLHVARTRTRPLATGAIGTKAALGLFCLLCLCAFLLVLLLNRYTVYLSVIGAFLAVIYPYLKRVTHLPQLGLGLAFSWGVPMAFAAENNHIPSVAWLLFLTAALWPVIYDTMYAMTDRNDDHKIGVKSTAILFGRKDRLIIGLLQCIFLLALSWVGYLFMMSLPYYLCLIFAAGLFVYQQVLLKDRDPALSFKAFLNNHWVGFVIFVGIAWSYAI